MPAYEATHRTADINRLVEAHFFRSDTNLQGDPHSRLDIRYVEAGGLGVVRVQGPGMRVRRTLGHIRERRSNSFAIGLPLQGSICVTQAATRDLKVDQGSFVITSGDEPFCHQTSADDQKECSILNLLVPAHMFYQRFTKDHQACGRSFSIASALACTASSLLEMISTEGDSIAPSSAAELGQAGLNALLTVAREQVPQQSCGEAMMAPHLRRALRYIDANFVQPGLTADQVASACKFSRRYLYYLLKEAQLGFSDYLWAKRLALADAWLAQPRYDVLGIAQIAARCGFQSASHFSAVYHAKYGRSPKARRMRELVTVQPADGNTSG